MAVFSDLRTLYHLCLSPVKGATHADRLESFYSKQAGDYDRFRNRLLKGRRELVSKLPMTPGTTWVDLGGGTGANLLWCSEKVYTLRRVDVVDLSSSLLAQCQQRINEFGWHHVHARCEDAITFTSPDPVDCVTASYSLTMIPDWFAAIDNAYRMLRPGGTIGVVDFYVSHKFPREGMKKHGWWTRNFWPAWFGADHVWIGNDALRYLQHKFETIDLIETRSRVPYLMGMKVPYFIFVGRKRV